MKKSVASIQAKRSSSRGLIHYIAHSKIDESKEPQTREIFNQYSDDLTVEKANYLLKKRFPPKDLPIKNCIIWLSLSGGRFQAIG